MGRSKAIIFDLDDTLYAERDYVSSGFRAIAEWVTGGAGPSSDRVSDELESLYDSGHRNDTYQMWLANRDLSDTEIAPTVAEMIDAYRGHSPSIAPHPATVPLLTNLKAANYKLGLVSDGYLNVQRQKFSALGLSPYFQATVFSDELGRENWKPSIKPFQAVLQQLRVTGADAIYVADNPLKDFIGPRKLGMKSIRVRASGGVYAEFEAENMASEPDVEVPRMDDVAAAIESLFS